MFSLVVGQPYDSSIQDWPEGCHFDYNDSGLWLHYMFNNPSDVEIQSIQSGDAEFALYIQPPVIFLLHKFGQMPWNDGSYSWWMLSEENRFVPELRYDLHALLKVVLIDSSNGVVKALRALTFLAEFTRMLHLEIHRQMGVPWSKKVHDEVIQSTYLRYTSEDLVLLSAIRCRGGE